MLSSYNIFLNLCNCFLFFSLLNNDKFSTHHNNIVIKMGLSETPVMKPVMYLCDA